MSKEIQIGCGKELNKCYMDGDWKKCGEFNEFCRDCEDKLKENSS